MSKRRNYHKALTVGSLRQAAAAKPKTGKSSGLSVGSLRRSVTPTQGIPTPPKAVANSKTVAKQAPKKRKRCCFSGCAGCPVFQRFQQRKLQGTPKAV